MELEKAVESAVESSEQQPLLSSSLRDSHALTSSMALTTLSLRSFLAFLLIKISEHPGSHCQPFILSPILPPFPFCTHGWFFACPTVYLFLGSICSRLWMRSLRLWDKLSGTLRGC